MATSVKLSVSVPQAVWVLAQAIAGPENESSSAIVQLALRAYVAKNIEELGDKKIRELVLASVLEDES